LTIFIEVNLYKKKSHTQDEEDLSTFSLDENSNLFMLNVNQIT